MSTAVVDTSEAAALATQERIKYDMHEGLLFLIELTDTLLITDPVTGQCHLEMIFEAIQESMSHSIITLPNTGYGVYLFNGTKTTSGLKTGIERLFQLQDLNPKDMKKIPDILEESTEKSDDDERPYVPLDVRFKPLLENPSENPLDDVLRVLQDDFLIKKDFQKLYTNKKIFFFTDNDKPIDPKNSIQKNILRNTCANLDDNYINIYTFFLSNGLKEFDDKLYSELMVTKKLPTDLDSDESDLIFDGPNTKPIDIKYIKERIMTRKEIKRKQLETTLELNDDVIIGIRGYSVYSHEKEREAKYLYENANVRKNVYSKRRIINEKTGEEYESTKSVYKYGSGNEDFISLTEEQDKKLKSYHDSKESFLRLLGFKDELSGIKFHYNLTTSSFIVPDEDAISGSTRTMAALFKSLTKLNKVAILFGKIRRVGQPCYYALQASKRPFSEGFFLIRLPFLDNIRQVPEGFENGVLSKDSKHDEQLRKITKLILMQLKLKNGYKPSDFKNPSLQKHFRILHDYLLQVEQDPNEDKYEKLLKEDDTLSKIHQIRLMVERSQLGEENSGKLFKYIQEWNELQKSIGK